MTRPQTLACVLLTAASVSATAADDLAARDLAATCASCHGTEGRSASRDIPALAGMPKDKIVSDMRAFRSGARPATVMHQLARGYTDAQIDQLAAYFAKQKN